MRNPDIARRSRHRGLTLVETIAAVVLLAVLASTVLGGLSAIMGQQARQQRRVEAAELANRLMLQYLDDPESLPPRTMPVAYGHNRYRWEYNETPTRLVSARDDVAQERQRRSALVVDRIKAVTFRVWLSEESGGSYNYDASRPNAVLTRLVDPVAALYRNPDTMAKILADDTRKRELLAMLTSTEAGGLLNRINNPRDAAPTPTPTPAKTAGETKGGRPGEETKGGRQTTRPAFPKDAQGGAPAKQSGGK